MANIGTFTAQNDSFTGTVRTLTINVKVKSRSQREGERQRSRLPHRRRNFKIGAE
jgi:uncharacterized protein (DUF736 family)